MLKPYLTILRLPGTLRFSSAGWLARLPISMVGLGMVLLVSAKTGSYGIAGSVSAAYVLVAAGAAPIQARMTDRLGQNKVVPVFVVIYALGVSSVILAVEAGLTTPWPQILAGLAGAFSPQIGSYVRARWTHLLNGKPELQTAYALEGLLDEVVFMVGPPLVTLLATAINPTVGLITAVVAGFSGGILFSIQHRTQPPVHSEDDHAAAKQPLGWATLAPVMTACLGLGVLFGSVEVIVVAFTTEQGVRSMAGVLLAIWATGSMLSALILGALKLKKSPLTRFQIGAVAMAITMLPLPFIHHLGVLGVVLFFAGFAISPTMIASVAVIQQTVPSTRLNEGIAWTTSFLVAGVALGAALAGQVIDHFGASTGFFVPLAAGLLAALGAFVGHFSVRQKAPVRVTLPAGKEETLTSAESAGVSHPDGTSTSDIEARVTPRAKAGANAANNSESVSPAEVRAVVDGQVHAVVDGQVHAVVDGQVHAVVDGQVSATNGQTSGHPREDEVSAEWELPADPVTMTSSATPDAAQYPDATPDAQYPDVPANMTPCVTPNSHPEALPDSHPDPDPEFSTRP